MKEEIQRIMKLVQEGKLSPDDAAELIEALQNPAPQGPPPPPEPPKAESGAKKDDPLASIVDSIERIAKEVTASDVGKQVRTGLRKGMDVIKQAAERAQKEGPMGIFASTAKKEIELPLNVPEGKAVRIDNPHGDITVTCGHESGTVTAVATVRGHSQEEANAKAELYTLMVEESADAIILKQPDLGGLNVDLKIKLNGHPKVIARSQAGDMSVEGCEGADLEGRSGDMSLKDVRGTVDVSTMSGDVSVSSSELASLTVENKSGDLTIASVHGRMNLRTGSGDITLTESSGPSLSIEAVSGDVALDLNRPVEGTVNARTVNGDLAVAVPDGCDCRVALSTLRGSLDCSLALEDEAKQQLRITGRLGGGAGTLDLSAVSGDVSLKQRAHATTA